MSNLSTRFADKLCSSKVLMQLGYSQVQIAWPTSKQLTAKVLLDGEYDFVLNRHHHLQGLVSDIDKLYQAIFSFSSFDIFWWSKQQPPKLTPEYFADKTIGVTSNSKSHPYYLIPFRSLADAGIQLAEQQITVFPSVDSLLEGFLNNDIDLVMWDKQIQNNVTGAALYASKQAWQVEGLQWFAAKNTDAALICEFAHSLAVYDSYLASINMQSKVVYDCP